MKKLIKKAVYGSLYRLRPARSIVIVLCSMRSGSTLLKALLGQADDVSHLREIDYRDFHPANKYYFYHRVCKLADERIIVLKKPHWFFEENQPWTFPDLENVKVIVLTRDVYPVVESIQRMMKSYQPRTDQDKLLDWGTADFVRYWAETYGNILDSANQTERPVQFVSYESLVDNPVDVTQKLFEFIGSSRTEGVSQYSSPDEKGWQWGQDDGSPKIRSMKVGSDKIVDTELVKTVNESGIDVNTVRRKLGYDSF